MRFICSRYPNNSLSSALICGECHASARHHTTTLQLPTISKMSHTFSSSPPTLSFIFPTVSSSEGAGAVGAAGFFVPNRRYIRTISVRSGFAPGLSAWKPRILLFPKPPKYARLDRENGMDGCGFVQWRTT